MDAETLAEGLRLAQAATEGPWTVYKGHIYGYYGVKAPGWYDDDPVAGVEDKRDAEAIAWFGTHGRELIEALQRVEKLCDEAESGEFASSGRDFGRGVSFLAGRVRAALRGEEQ